MIFGKLLRLREKTNQALFMILKCIKEMTGKMSSSIWKKDKFKATLQESQKKLGN